jgi:hypothetical protein
VSLTSSDRILRAKIAAHALHAQRDSRELTAGARAAYWQSLLAQVDPEHVLDEPERVRRAESLRRSRLYAASLKSAQTRRAKKASVAADSTDAQEVRSAEPTSSTNAF